jgi:hypothetical protein
MFIGGDKTVQYFLVMPTILTIPAKGCNLVIEQYLVELGEQIKKGKYKICTVNGEQIIDIAESNVFTDCIEAKRAQTMCPVTIGTMSDEGNQVIFTNNPEVIKQVNQTPKLFGADGRKLV